MTPERTPEELTAQILGSPFFIPESQTHQRIKEALTAERVKREEVEKELSTTKELLLEAQKGRETAWKEVTSLRSLVVEKDRALKAMIGTHGEPCEPHRRETCIAMVDARKALSLTPPDIQSEVDRLKKLLGEAVEGLSKILEQPQDTLSNSKALRWMVDIAKATLAKMKEAIKP